MTGDFFHSWPGKAAAEAKDSLRGSSRSKRSSRDRQGSTAQEKGSGAKPRSLEGNLLDARSRMGRSIIEIVEADFLDHGPEVISELRKKNPAAYARLISDLVHFKGLLNSERIGPKRKPRPLRMKELLKEMEDRPLDVNNPQLPPKHRERWLAAIEALQPRKPWDLTPDEVREMLGDDLATWWEKQLRHTGGSMPRRRMVAVRYHMKVRTSPKAKLGYR